MTLDSPDGGTPVPTDRTSESQGTSGAVSALSEFGKTAIESLRQYPALVVGVVGLVLIAIVLVAAAPTYGLSGLILLVVATALLVGVATTRRVRTADDVFKSEVEVTTMDTVSYALELGDENRQIIREALRSAALEAAEILAADAASVRANVFGLGPDNRLHMISSLTHNMENVDELTVSMPPGTGSTGRCYVTRAPNIAIRRSRDGAEPDWGVNVLAEAEMKKLVPGLCWIVSIPVFVGGHDDSPVWIMNVDGLAAAEVDRLQTLTVSLLTYAEFLSLLLRQTLKDRL